MKTSKKEFKNIKFDDILNEQLKDPVIAQEFLNVALEEYQNDEDTDAFLLVLEKLIKAQMPVSEFAKESKIERSHLYKILKKKVKPQFHTINRLLRSAGFKLQVVKA